MSFDLIRLKRNQAILAAWDEGYRKTLLVLPTGCGKTVVFSSVTENQVNKGHRVLIMAHRGELLDQAADKLKEASGLDSVLEKAESTSLGSFLPVTVGSVQSLAQEKRLARFPNNYFQDIIVDEAHHCLSDSYKRVLDHFPNANILGVTATPDRGDMKNLGEFFDSKAYEYSMTEAIREGYLLPDQGADDSARTGYRGCRYFKRRLLRRRDRTRIGALPSSDRI